MSSLNLPPGINKIYFVLFYSSVCSLQLGTVNLDLSCIFVANFTASPIKVYQEYSCTSVLVNIHRKMRNLRFCVGFFLICYIYECKACKSSMKALRQRFSKQKSRETPLVFTVLLFWSYLEKRGNWRLIRASGEFLLDRKVVIKNLI